MTSRACGACASARDQSIEPLLPVDAAENSAYGPADTIALDRRRHRSPSAALDVDAVRNLAHRRQVESERARPRPLRAGSSRESPRPVRACASRRSRSAPPSRAQLLFSISSFSSMPRGDTTYGTPCAARAARGGPQRPQDRSRGCARRRTRGRGRAACSRATARNTTRRACCDWKYQTFTPSTSTAMLCGTGESAGAVDAGREDVHVVAATRQRAAQAVHRHDRAAVANRRQVGRDDVQHLQ